MSESFPQALNNVAGPEESGAIGVAPAPLQGSSETAPPDQAEWVDIRCTGNNGGKFCGKLLFRAADLSVDKNGTPRKMGFDMKCRRCKTINYRIVVI